MKKFFEMPEVSSVELDQTDVIMASQVGKQFEGYTVVSVDATSQFEIWKGFNK